ncbi:MAG: hypothetical protein ACI4VN_01015 [Clostridia bacterium]
MENASKALLIGAATLIAILTISIAIRMFKSAYNVSKTYDSQAQSIESREFNSKFTRFYGAPKEDGTTQQQATIHDIITLANFAYNYNAQAQIDSTDISDPIHVSIGIEGVNPSKKITNLENKGNDIKSGSQANLYTYLLQNCYYINNNSPNVNAIIYFEIKINSQNADGKINSVTFKATDPSADNYIEL